MTDLSRQISDTGFAFLHGAAMRAELLRHGTLSDWAAFSASWDALELDTYMADGGRYRRRRHAVFAAKTKGEILRQPDQPHYQDRDYNALNGGIARWFAPIVPEVAQGASLRTILRFCRVLFDTMLPERDWHIELHQFRIEARANEAGQPTPEGMHRDGVDYVLVLLIDRINIASGMTTVHDLERTLLGSFTLTQPLDAALVHDRRVYHGVTAVEPFDLSKPAYRDVLVVTFRVSD
jgi:hypothetical protein